MTDLSFWIAALGIPLVVLFANVVVRKLEGLPQSALPDLILCFVVFDAVVVIQRDEFERFIPFEQMRDGVSGIYEMLVLVNIVIWFFALRKLEPQLLKVYESRLVTFVQNTKLVLASGLIATVVAFMSIAPFVYRG